MLGVFLIHIKRLTNKTNLSVFNQRRPISLVGHSLGSAGISRRTQFGNHPGTNPGCRNLSPLFHLCEPQFPHTGKETIEQQCRKDEICLKPFGSDEYRLLKVAIAISSIYGWGN